MIFDFYNESGLEFICPEELYGVIPEPIPMKKCIPEWFKKIPGHTPNRSPGGFPGMSAKKCLPLLDGMSLGWAIPLQSDVHVITNDDCSVLQARPMDRCPFASIERHSWDQVKSNKWTIWKQDPIKFINHWIIKTNPGWSCLFQTLPNELEKDFMCLTAVVDTDKYYNQINFPAVWLKNNFDGTLKAGTPIIQVIPFKRNTDNAKVRCEKPKEAAKRKKLNLQQESRESVYTKELREIR